MRLVLSLIVVLWLSIAVFAQTNEVRQIFEEGVRAAQNSDFENALEKFRRVKDLPETSADKYFRAKIHFNLGVCLYKLKKTNEAVSEFNSAIEIGGGNYPKVFYALAMAQKDLKNWTEAENAFRRSLEINRKDGESWFDLAMVLLAEKNISAARTAFENAIKYNTISAADAHNNLGVIFALEHNFQLAEKEFNAALSEPGAKSDEAAGNLRFCKFYRQNTNEELTAKFEFAKNQ